MRISFSGFVQGEWGEPWTPDFSSVFSIAIRENRNRLDWGIPVFGSFSSYVEYEGGSFFTEPNRLFSLGTLSYRNGTIEGDSGFDGDFPLTIELNIDTPIAEPPIFPVPLEPVPAQPAPFPAEADAAIAADDFLSYYPIGQTQRFRFNFNIFNTPNTTGNAVIDGDRLRFSTLGLSRQRFTIGETSYTLELIGFSENGGQTYVGEFNSPEESVALANLYGRIIKVPATSSTTSASTSSIVDYFIYGSQASSDSAAAATSAIASPEFDSLAISPSDLAGNHDCSCSAIIADFEQLNIFGEIAASAAIGGLNGIFLDLGVSGESFQLTAGIATIQRGGVRALDGDDRLMGSSDRDVANGNQGADILEGAEGDDYLRGGRDSDTLIGGLGDDLLNGNKGEDFADGGEGNDFLRGGQGNDTLIGGAGNDILVGDKGLDSLVGGSGADTFLLRVDAAIGQADPNRADRIADFNPSEGDRLGIVGNIDFTELSFNSIDINGNGIEDTAIQLISTGNILGVATDVAASLVQNAAYASDPEDIALAIG